MAKATKQTKKYASSGKLKQTIEKRRKFKQIKKKNEGRDAAKLRKERKGKERHVDDDVTDDDEEDDDEVDLENEVEDVNEGQKGNKGKG
jgi:nucleolar complex protein 2